MIGQDLLRYKDKQKYLCFDYETSSLLLASTGKKDTPNKPWQLGWLRYEGKRLIESREDWIKWENFEISKDAAFLTHFDWDTYNRKAQPAAPILEEFDSYLYDENYISIFANGFGFDGYIHNIYRDLVGKPTNYSWMKRAICIQVLHKAIVLEVRPPKIGTDDWVLWCFMMQNYRKKGLKTSLRYLCEYYGIPYDPNRHHLEANYDCELTSAVFNQIIWKIEI